MSRYTDELYRQNILDHYKNPRHRGHLPSFNRSADGDNPLCGDSLHVELKIVSGKISAIAFSGQGCAISQAAASMLAEEVAGKSALQVQKMPYARLLALLGIDPGPSRLKCALLSYQALQEALGKPNKNKNPKIR